MSSQPGSSLEERRERGLRLLEEMLGKMKAEEFKAALHGLCPDFEGYVIGFFSCEIRSRPGLDKRTAAGTLP